MKINYNCIRDVLLYIQEQQTFDSHYKSLALLNSDIIVRALRTNKEIEIINSLDKSVLKSKPKSDNVKYDEGDIRYSIKQLKYYGYIEATNTNGSFDFLIKDITPSGHEFIETIKEQNNWNKIIRITAATGYISLKTIYKIGISVATKAIEAQLNR